MTRRPAFDYLPSAKIPAYDFNIRWRLLRTCGNRVTPSFVPAQAGTPEQHTRNLSKWLLGSRLRGNERRVWLGSSVLDPSGTHAKRPARGTRSEHRFRHTLEATRMKARPTSVTVIAWVLIVIGAMSLATMTIM